MKACYAHAHNDPNPQRPDSLHRTLEARAALAGMSLSDYLLAEIRKVAEYPTVEELRERIASRKCVNLTVSPAEIIRQMRDSE